jgi:hypothetical protein
MLATPRSPSVISKVQPLQLVILVQQISNHLLAKSKRRVVVDQRHGPEFFNLRVVMQIELIADHGARSTAMLWRSSKRI